VCIDDTAASLTTSDVGEMSRKSRPALTQPKGTLPYVVSDQPQSITVSRTVENDTVMGNAVIPR